jgi:glutamate-1-semialdehyde 2,1-aminomutase
MSIIGHGVSVGGTYTNNKAGIAGAWATLKLLKAEPVIETINRRGTRLMKGLEAIFRANGEQVVMSGYPGMFAFALGVEKVTCQREWAASDRERLLRLAEAAMERGVMPDYDPREPWFLCYSHSEADIDRTLEVYAEIVKTVK